MPGWGGGPDHYVTAEEMAERAAAEEAAQKMAEARAAEDRRTAAMADAIRDAGAMIADAIRAAAGDPVSMAEAEDRAVRMGRERHYPVDNPPCMCPPGRVYVGCPVHGNGVVTADTPEVAAWLNGGKAEPVDADDPDMHDLLDPAADPNNP